MKKISPYWIVFLISLAFRVATALPLTQPGYMDASYSMHIAEQLVRGRGLVEEVLWNYLDNPAGLPHPSNLYWMPLTSFLIVPFYAVFGVSYRVAQIPFIMLASVLPVFAFYLGRKIFERDDYAWAGALFTLFSGFFTIYWVSPDNFAVFALVASGCLYLIGRSVETKSTRIALFAGIFIGLSHLTRADGLLLLGIAPLLVLIHRVTWRDALRVLVFIGVGYLVVMTPWFIRNWLVTGTLLASAGAKTVWLMNYDELFRFADDLTPARYFTMGTSAILSTKLNAASLNVFILAFSSLVVFLAPLGLLGLWRLRRRIEFQASALYAILLYSVMTLVFTFPSGRGTLFHSMSALVPFFALAVAPGLDSTVGWIARRRRTWNAQQATLVFRSGFIVLAAGFSIYLYGNAIWGGALGNQIEVPLWNNRNQSYPEVARWLEQHANPDDVVIAVNPVEFYNQSHHRAIVTPTDGLDAVLVAAHKYNARYLILEFDHPASLNDLYRAGVPVTGLDLVTKFNDWRGNPAFLFEITP